MSFMYALKKLLKKSNVFLKNSPSEPILTHAILVIRSSPKNDRLTKCDFVTSATFDTNEPGVYRICIFAI